MDQTYKKSWQQYEAGREYKRRLGLYETVRKNERFYRGDQWNGSTGDLPHPVFNLIRRITDHLIGSVLPGDLTIHYSDERLPFLENSLTRRAVTEGLATLDRHAAYRWKQSRMNELCHRALYDAAISGDGVFYCHWDDQAASGQPYLGDIRTELIPNTDLFVADVTETDLQAQEYVMLAGRASVSALRYEAKQAGVADKDLSRIRADDSLSERDADRAALDLSDAEKATYLLKFYRENGEVVFEKSTADCLIRRVRTGLTLYPIAYFSWYPTKRSFHGTPLISDIIPNQTYINTAYAMMMKHMRDTAFSKIIYDKSRIPEWSNEVGEAIAALGGGNVSDAVSVLGVGEMQDGYLALIENVIETTKSLAGASEAALGDERANNTSAILALQEASRISLLGIDARLCRCIGEVASIWADMLCAYCPSDRLIPFEGANGLQAASVDYATLRRELLRASAQSAHVSKFTPAATVATLDRLLDAGQITVVQYLKALPVGTIPNRDALLAEISTKGQEQNE